MSTPDAYRSSHRILGEMLRQSEILLESGAPGAIEALNAYSDARSLVKRELDSFSEVAQPPQLTRIQSSATPDQYSVDCYPVTVVGTNEEDALMRTAAKLRAMARRCDDMASIARRGRSNA